MARHRQEMSAASAATHPAVRGRNPTASRAANAHTKGTWRRIRFAAAALTVALAAALVLVQQIKTRTETELASEAAARAEEAPPVDVTRADMAPQTQSWDCLGKMDR
jgi:hypothetical protein